MSNALASNFNDPFDNAEMMPNPDSLLHTSRVKSHSGVISAIKDLTYDTIEVTVKYEGSDAFVSAAAGHYGTIKVNGIDAPRAYSFAKAPRLEGKNEVTFFIRRVQGGRLSTWFEKQDRVGEQVTVSGPMGTFGLDNSDSTIVCIAGGSGMSAIKALVEEAAAKGLERDCLYFYGARTTADLYCEAEMAAVTSKWAAGSKFTFIPVLSGEPEDSNWQGPRGLVTQYVKDHYIDSKQLNVNDIKVFFCGPPAMIDHGVAMLESAGVDSSALFYDKFEDMSSPAPVIDNAKCTLCDECLLVKPVPNCIVETSNMGHANGKVTSEAVRPGQTNGMYYSGLLINSESCIRCYACVDACPHDAISPDNSIVPNILRQGTA